jgi:hypothetical protein
LSWKRRRGVGRRRREGVGRGDVYRDRIYLLPNVLVRRQAVIALSYIYSLTNYFSNPLQVPLPNSKNSRALPPSNRSVSNLESKWTSLTSQLLSRIFDVDYETTISSLCLVELC